MEPKRYCLLVGRPDIELVEGGAITLTTVPKRTSPLSVSVTSFSGPSRPKIEFDYLPQCQSFESLVFYIRIFMLSLLYKSNVTRGTQITSNRPSWWLYFVWWHLVFLCPYWETCFTSSIWRLEFWGGSYVLGKLLHSLLKCTLHVYIQSWFKR
jgi:hypothetical protein